MSRISNDLAGQISLKLTEKSRLAVQQLHVSYRELVTKTYEDQTPSEVKALLELHPEWCHTRTSVTLEGMGFRWVRVSTTRPVVANTQGDCHMKMTAKIVEKLTNAKRKLDKSEADYNALCDETKQALLTLKTFNNIRKELPEAAPLLPPPLSNSLIVNFDSLHKKLSKQPEMVKTVEELTN